MQDPTNSSPTGSWRPGLRCRGLGESLEFDGPGPFSLSLIVTEATHWFFGAAESCQPFRLLVEAHPVPTGRANARELLDPAALERWVGQYATLELPA